MSRKGRFHDKLVRSLTLQYLQNHGESADNIDHICDMLEICPKTIFNWKREKVSGKLEDGRLSRQVIPWTVDRDHFSFLLNHLAREESRLYQDEMCDVLFQQFRVSYTQQQIQRRLINQHGHSIKKVEVHAKEQDAQLRDQYQHMMRPPRLGGSFTAPQIVFVDESHSKMKDRLRLRGTSAPGEVICIESAFCAQNYSNSAIGALSIEGVLSAKTYDETVDADAFENYIEFELLPLCNAFPRPRSALILDNAKTHSKVRLEALCAAQGMVLIWLPPYSYDKNPIEPVFHNTKALLKRRYGLSEADANAPNPRRLLECLLESVTPDQACNFFRNCHIEVSPEAREWANR